MKAAIDIILLIIIALCTWNGYKKGLISGIAAILAIAVAIFGGSLLSSAYAHEIVPALEPFVDGYIDSQDNRSAVLESMGYADTDYSVEDVLATDSSLKYDYAYECMLNVGFYSRISEKLAVDAVELAEDSEMDTTDAVVSVICDTVTYVGGVVLGFLLIVIFLTALANVGNLSLRLPNMENLDEIGGALVGFLKGFIYCILLCWLLGFLGLIIGRETLGDTTLARFFLVFDFLTGALL